MADNLNVLDRSSRYDWTPTDHGLVAWAFDLTHAVNVLTLTAGTLYLVRMHVPVTATVTNILLRIGVAGSSLTSGQNFAALYTAAGAKLDVTADQTTAWASTGNKTAALAGGARVLAAGDYYGAMWANGSTPPQPAGGTTSGATAFGLSAPNLRYAIADTGLTTTAPSNFATQSAAGTIWMGLS